IDPLLAPLANYGGPTQTMGELPGSPAIDKGSNALAVDASSNPLTTDQRGSGFARIIGGTVDIGACEYLFADNFSGTGALSSRWQIPPLPEKFQFTYRRLRGFGGFQQNNAAISVGAGFDVEQVLSQSLLNPALAAQVDASQAMAVGVAGRIQ